MKYLLDTNVCIYLMKGNSEILESFIKKRKSGIGISSVSAAELYYGVYNSAFIEKNSLNLANFLIGLTILEFDSGAAVEYGRIRAYLRKNGSPIGLMDMLIAAHAKSEDLVLVTNNVGEFGRIEGLRLDNWLV